MCVTSEGDPLLNSGDYDQEIEVACFAGDGRRLLTVQEAGVAWIRDIVAGKQVGEIRPSSPLQGRTGLTSFTTPFQVSIEAAAMNPSGKLALLGLNDGTAGISAVGDSTRRATFHHPDRQPAEG
jgi:hypothetical protein